jgi:hypothetical protein
MSVGGIEVEMKRAILICLLLTACSSLNSEASHIPEAAPPDQSVVQEGFKKAALEAKLKGPLQSSPVRIATLLAPGSPGVFIACLRNVPPVQPGYPYAVFFKDNAYTTTRMSVLMDDCYAQPYQPFTPPPAEKPKKASK